MAEVPRDVRERFQGSPDQDAVVLVGEPPRFFDSVLIEDYDPAWADRFAAASSALGGKLGDLAVGVEHVGSTSVPGLAAKPIDLRLPDTDDEPLYIPVLVALGYRLVLREPWWPGHRMLVSAEEDVNPARLAGRRPRTGPASVVSGLATDPRRRPTALRADEAASRAADRN